MTNASQSDEIEAGDDDEIDVLKGWQMFPNQMK